MSDPNVKTDYIYVIGALNRCGVLPFITYLEHIYCLPLGEDVFQLVGFNKYRRIPHVIIGIPIPADEDLDPDNFNWKQLYELAEKHNLKLVNGKPLEVSDDPDHFNFDCAGDSVFTLENIDHSLCSERKLREEQIEVRDYLGWTEPIGKK